MRNQYLERSLRVLKSLVFSSLVVFVALIQFWKVPVISTAVQVLAFLSWILALKDSDRMSRSVSVILVATGAVLFILTGVPVFKALSTFSDNTQILMVMVLVPLLGTVIDMGGYSESLSIVCQGLRNPFLLHFVASFLAYATGSVLLNAAIALVWAVMVPVVRRAVDDPETFLASSVPRGYNASLLWTPASPCMAVALSLTGIQWSSLFNPGLLLSLVMLALATLVQWRDPLVTGGKSPPGDLLQTTPFGESLDPSFLDRRRAVLKTGALALGLASFIGGVICLEAAGFTAIQAVVPCIVVAVLVWSLFLRKLREAVKASVSYVSEKIPGLSRQYLLMTTAGFIGTAAKLFAGSNFASSIPSVLPWSEQANKLAFTLLTSLLIWLISILGIHPLIGMSVTYSLVSRLASAYTGRHVTLTLLLGSALGFNISPVSATMLVTSSCCGRNTFDTGIKLQWRFVLCMWVVGSFILSLLNV